MGSNSRSGLPAGSRKEPTRVLVCLDALFPDEVGQPEVLDGFVFRGWVRGVLHRWVRTSSGHWVGVVTVTVPATPHASDLGSWSRPGFLAREQLVPAGALRLDTSAPGFQRR